MRILNSAQMREADRRCTGDIGIASIVLMENAGRQVVAAMEAMFSDLALRKIVVLCGPSEIGAKLAVTAQLEPPVMVPGTTQVLAQLNWLPEQIVGGGGGPP